MKHHKPACLKLICLFILLSFCSTGQAQISVEIGPSYIVNMSNYVWNNATGLNLSINYKVAKNFSINPRLAVYKFLSAEGYIADPILLNTQNSFPFFSLADNEVGFFDVSMGLKTGPTNHFINPIFSLRAGVHFIRNTESYRTIIPYDPPPDGFVGPYNSKKVNTAIGFGGAGFGLLLNLSDRIYLVLESSFSSSFDANYIFVPVDLTFRINL